MLKRLLTSESKDPCRHPQVEAAKSPGDTFLRSHEDALGRSQLLPRGPVHTMFCLQVLKARTLREPVWPDGWTCFCCRQSGGCSSDTNLSLSVAFQLRNAVDLSKHVKTVHLLAASRASGPSCGRVSAVGANLRIQMAWDYDAALGHQRRQPFSSFHARNVKSCNWCLKIFSLGIFWPRLEPPRTK